LLPVTLRNPTPAGGTGKFRVFARAQRASNIHRLCDIRDAANNMPAVNAVKALEMLDAEAVARPAGQPTLGIVIKFITQAPQPASIVDITPKPPIIDAGE
jgi:hypothetical protein